ncbi:hypothetical protein ACLVWU_07800 [Bdellovibrio sp. HCB290]|uniref:hypothetical protein n=1 Tax=Bdellovibrio sp. HCB290 TaxID=3394356 RepID=UPI0039B69655
MSRHNKGRGFSQTSKRYEGNLKEQRRAAHNKQMDHSADSQMVESSSSENSENREKGSPRK